MLSYVHAYHADNTPYLFVLLKLVFRLCTLLYTEF